MSFREFLREPFLGHSPGVQLALTGTYGLILAIWLFLVTTEALNKTGVRMTHNVFILVGIIIVLAFAAGRAFL